MSQSKHSGKIRIVDYNPSYCTPVHLLGLMHYVTVENNALARSKLHEIGIFVISDGGSNKQFAVWKLDSRYSEIIALLNSA